MKLLKDSLITFLKIVVIIAIIIGVAVYYFGRFNSSFSNGSVEVIGCVATVNSESGFIELPASSLIIKEKSTYLAISKSETLTYAKISIMPPIADGIVKIKSGIKPGEIVILGQKNLPEGVKVNVKINK